MRNIAVRTVFAQGREFIYTLERKMVKNMNLRIRRDGSIYVSANDFISDREVDGFVSDRAAFIANAQDKFKKAARREQRPEQYISGEKITLPGQEYVLRVFRSDKESVSIEGGYIHLSVKDVNDLGRKSCLIDIFVSGQCRAVFGEMLYELYSPFEKYGVERPQLRIRDMKSRWGTCHVKKGIVTLNKRLLAAPRGAVEYVVLHELCHLIYPDHSKQFYDFLAVMMPDWKERKQLLNNT